MTQIPYENGTDGTTVKILKILASLGQTLLCYDGQISLSETFCYWKLFKLSNGYDRQQFFISSMQLGIKYKHHQETGLTIVIQTCTKSLSSLYSADLSPSDWVMRGNECTKEYIYLCSRQGEDQNMPNLSLACWYSQAWATEQYNIPASLDVPSLSKNTASLEKPRQAYD